jgi:hypothetical protein
MTAKRLFPMKRVSKVLKRQACVAIRFVSFPAKRVLKNSCLTTPNVSHERVLKNKLPPCYHISQVPRKKGVENFILLKLHVRVSRGVGVEK